MEPLVLLALAGLLPLAIRFWARRIRAHWALYRQMPPAAPHAASDPREEQRLVIIREAALAGVSIAGGLYLLFHLIAPAVAVSAAYLDRLAAATDTYQPLVASGRLALLVTIALRLLVASAAFLVIFGLSSALLPRLFPPSKRTWHAMFIPEALAFVLAATFALWLGTSPSAFGVVLNQLTRGFLGILLLFLTVLFGTIRAFLRPKRSRRRANAPPHDGGTVPKSPA